MNAEYFFKKETETNGYLVGFGIAQISSVKKLQNVEIRETQV
jgi:hypothetical protein